jgi:hypothetical protein
VGLRRFMATLRSIKKGGEKMNKVKISVICFWVIFLALGMMVAKLWAAEEFKISAKKIVDNKKLLDDQRPWLTNLAFKKILSPELYSKLTYDVDEMKKLWAECVGFRAPDVVGKIAPEIMPGTYSYKDKEKYPGLKELMIPLFYNEFFKPGGPPFAGSFPEIKIVPTRQYYWSLPIAKATKESIGRVQLDDDGILREETYVAGYPFPRPDGKFKANQIVYNKLRSYEEFENNYAPGIVAGFTRSLRQDQEMAFDGFSIRLKGRVQMEPLGWLDERAKKLGEHYAINLTYLAPRDMFGNVINMTKYLDSDKFDQVLLYIGALRRVRVMGATDIQDVVGGADNIYADANGYSQKPSKKIFPHKFEVIAEREYLFPVISDGSGYFSSQGLELRNYEWERRPMYVVKMTQLDKSFVYSYRIGYFDKETLLLSHIENYDQKGRLYRSANLWYQIVPEMGNNFGWEALAIDHLDQHTTFQRTLSTPAPWIDRTYIGVRGLVIKGK